MAHIGDSAFPALVDTGYSIDMLYHIDFVDLNKVHFPPRAISYFRTADWKVFSEIYLRDPNP